MKNFYSGILLLLVLLMGPVVGRGQLYWNTNGTSALLTATNWGTSASGPFTTAWTNSSNINFTANSSITNVTNIPVGNLNIINGSTVTLTAAGTYSTNALVRTFDIGTGSNFIWNSQSVSTAAGTGFIKNGAGIWNIGAQANLFPGGFTLNAGTIIIGGANAIGGGVLTINGGILAPNSATSRTPAVTGTITIGGDFQLGDAVNVPTGTGNLFFTNLVSIGSSNRTISIGGVGTYTLNGIVSGSGTGGLTVTSSSTGLLLLTNVNTYPGATTVTSGELRLNPSGNNTLTGACTFNGGKLSTTGITSGRTISFGSINISDNSFLALETGNAHSVSYGALGTLTPGKILTITGWQGASYAVGTTTGTIGKVFIGTSAILTAAQLAQIRFNNGTNNYAATQLSTGEIVPTTVLVVSAISNQIAGTGFGVTVTAKDLDGNARNLTNATGITLTSNGNAGAITGTTTGNISAGGNTVTISGVILPTAGTSVIITASRNSGDMPNAGVSNTFDVIASSPIITRTPATLTGFTYSSGTGPSTSQSFSITGSALTPASGNLTVSCLTNYEVSTDGGSTWGASKTLAYTGGAVSATNIFVRLKAGLAVGNYNSETITISGGGATDVTVTVSGNVTLTTFTSIIAGDWNTAATWDKNAVPSPGDNVIVNTVVYSNAAITRNTGTTTTINASTGNLGMGATYTNDGTTTVNGTFQLNTGGYANGANNLAYAATGSYLVFNNGGTYTVTTGQRFWPSTNQPYNVNVNTGSNANLNDGARTIGGTMSLSGGFINTDGLTVNGTLLINQNGYVSIQSPIYGASSLLNYNTNTNPYNNGWEWSSVTSPANVQLSGITILNYPAIGTAARSITGNLIIDLNSSLFMDYGAPAIGVGALTIGGNVVINGSLSLGNQIGGDLIVKGNWTLTGTFTHNNRLVNFNGTAAQSLTGNTGFGYFKIDNAAGLTLSGAASSVTVNTQADFTLGKILIGSNNFILNTGSTVGTAGATSYVVTDGTGKLIRNQTGNTAILFPVGIAANYTPLTITNTGTINNISVNVKTPVTNAVFDASKIVNLEWSVLSTGAGATTNITYQWNTANQAGSFVPTAASQVANYQTLYTVVGTGIPAGSNPYTLSATGLAIPTSGTNIYVVGNSCAITTPAQPSTITGSASITPPQSGVAYSVTNVTGVTYTWAYSGTNVTIASGQGTNAITLNYAANATAGSLTVTPSVGTCIGIARTLAITIVPVNDLCSNATTLTVGSAAVSGTVTGALTTTGSSFVYANTKNDVWYSFTPTCTGSHTITLTFTKPGTEDIDFDVFTGPCPTTGTAANTAHGVTTTETVTATFTFGTTYYIRVIDYNTNAAAFAIQITGSAPSQPAAFTSSSASPCVGVAQTYTVPVVTNAISYTWSFPGGWSGTSTTNSISLTPTAAIGNVSVSAVNCYGTGTATTISVTPVATPATPGIISGNISICNSTSNTYSINAVAGATSYTWTLPSGWTGTSTTTSITTTASGTSGNITVTANNNCGNNGVAQTLTVTVTSIASPLATAGTLVGSNSFLANWGNVAGATGYYVDVYTSSPLPTDLFISEYVEGSASNKYIEIFNGTGSTIDLSNYRLRLYANGAGTPTNDVLLSGNLNNNSTIVYQNSGSTIYGGSVTNNASVNFNGNDAVALFKVSTSTNVDIIGRIGEDPGTAWTSGSLTTLDKTLVRKSTIYAGISTNPGAGFPTLGTEWDQFNIDIVSTLGSHSFTGGVNYITGYQNVYTTDNFIDVTGLNPSTTYYYVVRASNGTCTSVNSNQIAVTTGVPCTSSASITAFTPATGPAGTVVTITGSGFTGVTGVKFGSLNATSFTIVNDNSITARTPANTPVDKITLVKAPCNAVSATNFVPLLQTGTCGSTSAAVTELFISEVYDALTGSLSYVEIFNGTLSTITLTGVYEVRIVTGTNTINDYALTGTIASGATHVVRIGTSSSVCSLTPGDTYPSGSGFNGNDRVYLRKNGTTNIDYVPNPNYGGSSAPGFSQLRNAAASGTRPNTTYIPADWTISNTEDCSNLGVSPYVLNATTVTINSHPTDVDCNQTITFSVAVTTTGSGTLGYVWRYNAPGSATWNLVSTITGVTLSPANMNTITISGNTSALKDYQFYVDVSFGSPGCTVTSNAARYTYESRLAYRSKQSGNWSDKNIWEMSNDLSTWVNACTYPVAANSDQVTIRNTHSVVMDISSDIAIDKLTIDVGAILSTNSDAGLDIYNGVAGAADFIINGTFIDGASTGNSLGFDGLSSWEMGTNATLIRTNTSSSTVYRDNYQGGITNIPSSANWIIRGNSTPTNVSFTSVAGAIGSGSFPSASYYPNLTIESSSLLWNPAVSSSRFTGASGFATIKGNLDIGGTGAGTVVLYNENTNSQPLLVLGNTTIRTGSTYSNNGSAKGTGLEIRGNLIVDGTLTNNGGTALTGNLVFSGTGTQNITGSGTMNLEDVAINNTTASANVMVNKSFDIPGTLSFGSTASRLSFSSSSNITLKSSLARTANVDKIPSLATPVPIITYAGEGRFVVERYINSGTGHPKSWQYVSTPTYGQTVLQSWQENNTPLVGYGTQITSPLFGGSTGFDAYSLAPSMKTFTSSSGLWTGIANTGVQVNNKLGYMLFIRGDRTTPLSAVTAVPTVIRTTGKIYQPSDAPPQVDAANVYQSVGNPYASPISLVYLFETAPSTDFFQLATSVTVWDPSMYGYYAVGGYQTISKTNFYKPVPGGTSLYPSVIPFTDIQSGQAFFIQSSGGAGSINFTENAKSSTNKLVNFAPTNTNNGNESSNSFVPNSNKPSGEFFRTSLFTATNIIADGNVVAFAPNYDNAMDADDARKMFNSGENFTMLRNGNWLAVEARSTIRKTDTIFYAMYNLKRQAYQLRFAPENMQHNNLNAYLIDNYLKSRTPISLTDSSFVNISLNADAASALPNRFYVVFVPKQSNLPNNPSPETVPKNLITDADKKTATGTAATISVYPNPVAGKQLHLQVTGFEKGNYRMELNNQQGQLMYSSTVQVNGAAEKKLFKLPASLAAGQYQLNLIATNGSNKTLNLVIQ